MTIMTKTFKKIIVVNYKMEKRIYIKQSPTLTKEEKHKNSTKEYYKRKGQLLINKKTICKKLKMELEDLNEIRTIEELYLFVMNYMKNNGVIIDGLDEPVKFYKVALKIY